MTFSHPPATAACRQQDIRPGFEVAFLQVSGGGRHIDGPTAALESGDAFAVEHASGPTRAGEPGSRAFRGRSP
ncbi:hypothetical protein ACIQMR_09535 [Streptomyces sp. NPDC091376]|uniref:hypothetical protein n=1 Tax=Streptomyces sp. NPDC091376 TaxID=3365994 RepID=UPI003810CE81